MRLLGALKPLQSHNNVGTHLVTADLDLVHPVMLSLCDLQSMLLVADHGHVEGHL